MWKKLLVTFIKSLKIPSSVLQKSLSSPVTCVFTQTSTFQKQTLTYSSTYPELWPFPVDFKYVSQAQRIYPSDWSENIKKKFCTSQWTHERPLIQTTLQSLTSTSSWVKFSGSSPIMLARCRFPMSNSSTCFWMNSIVNFSGPAAARFFLRWAELTQIRLLSTWRGGQGAAVLRHVTLGKLY